MSSLGWLSACAVFAAMWVLSRRALVRQRRQLAVTTEKLTAQLDALASQSDQGFLFISPAGIVTGRHAAVLDRFFTPLEPGETVWHYLARVDSSVARDVELAFTQLLQGQASHFPERLGRCSLRWVPVAASTGELEQLVLMVDDLTLELQIAAARVAQHEQEQLFELVMRDRAGFLDFLATARDEVSRLEQPGLADFSAQAQVISTLRQHCAAFGMKTVEQVCLEVEADIARRDDGVQMRDREKVRSAFASSARRALRVMQFIDEFTALAGRDALAPIREAWHALADDRTTPAVPTEDSKAA